MGEIEKHQMHSPAKDTHAHIAISTADAWPGGVGPVVFAHRPLDLLYSVAASACFLTAVLC